MPKSNNLLTAYIYVHTDIKEEKDYKVIDRPYILNNI